MTTWTVERDARGWSVVAERDGVRQEPRNHLTGLPCVAARTIRQQLEWAYSQGAADVRASIYEALGD